MNNFILKKCNDSNIQNAEIKNAIDNLNKKDLCYVLNINPNCCFEKEKPLKNRLMNDIGEIPFNVNDLNALSQNQDLFKLDLFKLLIYLKNTSEDVLDKILLLNFSIKELKFLTIDLKEKYGLLSDLDKNVLYFILVSKNIKCDENKHSMIAKILSKFSLKELKSSIDKYNKINFNNYLFLNELDDKMLNRMLFSNGLPLYNNYKKYKISCLCYNFSPDKLKDIISEITDTMEILNILSVVQLDLMLNMYDYRYFNKREKNTLMILRKFTSSEIEKNVGLLKFLNPIPSSIQMEILLLNLTIDELKPKISNLSEKFNFLDKLDENILMLILVSNNLDVPESYESKIANILSKFSLNELKSLTKKIYKTDFNSFIFLKKLDDEILDISSSYKDLRVYESKKYKIASLSLNFSPEDLESIIEEINCKMDLLKNLSLESIDSILDLNNIPPHNSKKDKIHEICAKISYSKIKNDANSPEIKEIEEKIRIQEKRMKEFRKISVGTDFSNREKFFR